ncbi:MAG: helix-turn-helix domain-containing protein [Dysgonamonadaceae bacterium]|nr:helix-turn-helix domain-containing protein [Dysgonamonadaceae bacterium]
MNKIKELRKGQGLTQADMADKLGISESQYCLLENGKRKMSLQMALDISLIFKKTPNDIFLPDNFAKCQVIRPTGTDS